MTDDERRPLTVRGVQYRPTHEDVLKAMSRVQPRPVQPGQWYAVVRGRKHTLKHVAAKTLGVKRSTFSRDHLLAFARYTGLEFGQEPGTYEP